VFLSYRLFRRFCAPNDQDPAGEDGVWHDLIDLRGQIGGLVTQSGLELQFIVSQIREFLPDFDGWHDAYDTIDRPVNRLDSAFWANRIWDRPNFATLHYKFNSDPSLALNLSICIDDR
jgi:hypothetical protein